MGIACDACGSTVADGDAFCGECGERISWESEAVTAVNEPEAPQAENPPVAAAAPPPPAPEPQARLCPNCGGGLTPGENFCAWCGAAVAAGAPGTPPPPRPIPPAYGNQGAGPAGATFNQGANEVSDRVKGTWENAATRLPVMFLGAMVLGFVLIADQTNIGIVYPLVLGGVVFALLVLHATSPASGDGPILGAAGIALVFASLASLFGSFILIALVASGGASFEFEGTQDESITVTLGGALALVGSVGLFLTTLRAYILDAIQRR